MEQHPPPVTETFQEIIYRANEPLRLLVEMLYEAGDADIRLSAINTLVDALQELSSARIDAAFRVVDEQIGVIHFDDAPEPKTFIQKGFQATAFLEKAKKTK